MAYSQKIMDILNRKKESVTTTPSQPKKRVQREGGLQIQCVTWFRAQYPAFARLLYHAKNEAAHSSKAVAIQAAAGVVPGVPDLILALPAIYGSNEETQEQSGTLCCGDGAASAFSLSLGIELKYGKTNNQSPAQREYQRFYEAAGHRYIVARSLDDFITAVRSYMAHVPTQTIDAVKAVWHSDETTANNIAVLQRIINNK